jgi:hypothetical protein
MILREATILYKGYDPLKLTKGSHKRICCSCNSCGKVRYTEFRIYSDLCQKCTNSIKNKSLKMRKITSQSKLNISRSKETRKKISNSMLGIKHTIKRKKNKPKLIGKLNPNWKGGINGIRDYVKPERNCIKLNHRFRGCEMHHLNRNIVIFIPKELHKHFYHNLKSNQGILEMNTLAYQFINGGL